jgi:hypothetical protein
MNRVFFFVPSRDDFDFFVKKNDKSFSAFTGLEAWIYQSFILLKSSLNNYDFRLTDKPDEKGIIFFHKKYFPLNYKPRHDQYLICLQADLGRHPSAQMHVVQNPFQAKNIWVNKRLFPDFCFGFAGTLFVPHWPQAGLIQRDERRGVKIETISYLGQSTNLSNSAFIAIKKVSEQFGLNFILKESPQDWTDYSHIDIVIALRDFGDTAFYAKPTTKIINGIFSGAITLAGFDSSACYIKSAYCNQLRQVKNIDQLKFQFEEIIENPAQAFYESNLMKSQLAEFTTVKLIRQWTTVIQMANIMAQKWSKVSSFERDFFFWTRGVH